MILIFKSRLEYLEKLNFFLGKNSNEFPFPKKLNAVYAKFTAAWM